VLLLLRLADRKVFFCVVGNKSLKAKLRLNDIETLGLYLIKTRISITKTDVFVVSVQCTEYVVQSLKKFRIF
jgi:hypothetical protein